MELPALDFPWELTEEEFSAELDALPLVFDEDCVLPKVSCSATTNDQFGATRSCAQYYQLGVQLIGSSALTVSGQEGSAGPGGESAFTGGGGSESDLASRAKVFNRARERRRAKAQASAKAAEAVAAPPSATAAATGSGTTVAAPESSTTVAVPGSEGRPSPMVRARQALTETFGPKAGMALTVALTHRIHLLVQGLDPEDAEALLRSIAERHGNR
jgi:hypothetical protein